MPPVIAVREDSSVVVSDNTVVGGGVAGVMVQGTAVISGNQFQGNGPRAGGPPNFAAWIQAGSKVSFFNNRTDRWRHGLFAGGANQIWATNNTVSNFLGSAIVVDNSKLPAHVFGNVALSDSENDKAATVKGPQGIVTDNARKAPEPSEGADNADTPAAR